MIPLPLLALALTAGGTVAHASADNQSARARSAALDAERTRQRGMEQRQQNLAQGSQDEMARFTEDQDQRKMDLTQFYEAPLAGDANVTAGMIAPEGTSSITTRELQTQSGNASQRASENAANLASMRSFGDLLGDRMRGMGRASGEIDQLTGFRRGSSDANAFELDAASMQGGNKRLLGDLLKGSGAVLGGYSSMAGAGNPVVTNSIDRWLPGGDRLAAGLRGAGVQNVNSVRGGFLG